jgi:hypothetical protein
MTTCMLAIASSHVHRGRGERERREEKGREK